jgi:glutathione-specific gamma-glutamylcyclotransferase
MTTPMPSGPLWIFGYGSLIWHPGFRFTERRVARLEGWHRSFCMRSIHHRGTPQDPGLVLALDQRAGAACDGLAFAVEAGQEDETIAILRERELISSAYLEAHLPVLLRGGAVATALTYVIDPDHDQYCGGLDLETQARIIADASGRRGSNAEYLLSTASDLADLGIDDADLAWLAARVRDMSVQRTAP